MKINYFEVSRVNNKETHHILHMNKDINIITGRNGAGKTSALKLLWLLVSGNLKQAIAECYFSSVTLVTDIYILKIDKNLEDKISIINFESYDYSGRYDLYDNTQRKIFEDENDSNSLVNKFIIKNLIINRKNEYRSHEDKAIKFISEISERLSLIGESLYFPTFRRIEGGFSLGEAKVRGSISSDLEDAMSSLSKKFSRGSHLFVSSLSMSDVSQFLLKEYSNLNDISSSEKNILSQQVISMIKNKKSSRNNLKEANHLLSEILEKIELIEEKRTILMRPLMAVQKVVSKIFKHKGINFGENLNFGDAASAVTSDKLSAGEKQLLSFICYNAFFNDAIFIIDEPELSLHVDWQRSFFKILMDQNPRNQFIVSTHSPFIYGKYPDKEVALNDDRGESED